jgi:hypothetical protein
MFLTRPAVFSKISDPTPGSTRPPTNSDPPHNTVFALYSCGINYYCQHLLLTTCFIDVWFEYLSCNFLQMKLRVRSWKEQRCCARIC